MLSKILMVMLLAILAYIIWFTMSGSEFFTNLKHSSTDDEVKEDVSNNESGIRYENFANNVQGLEDNINSAQFLPTEQAESPEIAPIPLPTNKPLTAFPKMGKLAPVNLSNVNEINYASVPSSFVGSLPSGDKSNEDVNDVYVEGTDLLAAPLADRFYYTNSISNVNRNASSDLRGDIPTPYNDNFTPFYQSAIYGEPLTVNRLGDAR
jgi:hypothetical protein